MHFPCNYERMSLKLIQRANETKHRELTPTGGLKKPVGLPCPLAGDCLLLLIVLFLLLLLLRICLVFCFK